MLKAQDLYHQLEQDFITADMSDEWAKHMKEVEDFLCDNFKNRSMGLVCDFAEKINKIYTAVFPSNKVMEQILGNGTQDGLLFVHHPSIWDIRRTEIFYLMDKKLLTEFQEKRIAIYNLHVPLDNNGPYSTSVTLAKALGVQHEKDFAPYFGALCGVFGKGEYSTIEQLKNQFQKVVGHEVKLYHYGNQAIKDNKIAVVAGGGNEEIILSEVAKEGINTFITGITAKNDYSQKAHDFAKNNKINILGGTHYSTEKFACIAMTEYFEKLGLPSEFIDDVPVIEDM
ncbi:MAG: Nif3-like dinuclear metal center hexameric protein [Spirochaetes bacterium]|nr:Nif3-like dinuclear metal center hexameric protein [Spirochaetota bacterium]